MNIENEDLDLGLDLGNPQESESQVEKDPAAQVLYDLLIEKGWIDSSDEFDGTLDFIDAQIDTLPARLLKGTLDELDPNKRKLMEFIVSAPDADLNELREFYKTYLQEQEPVDVKSLDAARAFLESELASKGLKAKAIQVQLDEWEEENMLIQEAESLLAKKENKTDKILSDKRDSLKQKEDERRMFVSAVQKHLMETKWKQERINKVKNTLPKVNDIVKNILSNPEALVQFADLLTYFNGKSFDLTHLEQQNESKVANKLKDIIAKNGFNQSTSGASGEKGNIEDFFKNFKAVVN